MDEVQETVFKPNDSEREFAIIIEPGDAPVVRDALKAAAEKVARRKPTMGHAVRRKEREQRVLDRYAERFEQVRLAEAAAFAARVLRKSSQD